LVSERDVLLSDMELMVTGDLGVRAALGDAAKEVSVNVQLTAAASTPEKILGRIRIIAISSFYF
jgi:hypothetical protein